MSHMIEQGGYGDVYKGFLCYQFVAIKIPAYLSENVTEEFNHEVQTLGRLSHPNVIKLIGICSEKCALVYEFVPNKSLEDHLHEKDRRQSLLWKMRVCIAVDICLALIYLHTSKPHGIAHGDVKPGNILLDFNYSCKLTDFGNSHILQLLDNESKLPFYFDAEPRGTYFYWDPEYLATGKLTSKTDVLGFGVILLQLVTGRAPMGIRMMVADSLESGSLHEIVDTFANWPLEVAEKMARLGLRCIVMSGKDRPDLETEVLAELKSMELAASSQD